MPFIPLPPEPEGLYRELDETGGLEPLPPIPMEAGRLRVRHVVQEEYHLVDGYVVQGRSDRERRRNVERFINLFPDPDYIREHVSLERRRLVKRRVRGDEVTFVTTGYAYELYFYAEVPPNMDALADDEKPYAFPWIVAVPVDAESEGPFHTVFVNSIFDPIRLTQTYPINREMSGLRVNERSLEDGLIQAAGGEMVSSFQLYVDEIRERAAEYNDEIMDRIAADVTREARTFNALRQTNALLVPLPTVNIN